MDKAKGKRVQEEDSVRRFSDEETGSDSSEKIGIERSAKAKTISILEGVTFWGTR